MYATRSARAQAAAAQTSADRNAGYDQIQEDLENLGERFDRYVIQANEREAKDAREIRYQGKVIRHLDDEINELRAQMVVAGITPPTRKPWPPYPGESELT